MKAVESGFRSLLPINQRYYHLSKGDTALWPKYTDIIPPWFARKYKWYGNMLDGFSRAELVGGFHPFEKYARQMKSFPQGSGWKPHFFWSVCLGEPWVIPQQSPVTKKYLDSSWDQETFDDQDRASATTGIIWKMESSTWIKNQEVVRIPLF